MHCTDSKRAERESWHDLADADSAVAGGLRWRGVGIMHVEMNGDKNSAADTGREYNQVQLGMRLQVGIQSQFGHVGAGAIWRGRVADEEAIKNIAKLGGQESSGSPFLDAKGVVAHVNFGVSAEMSLETHAQWAQNREELVEVEIDVQLGQAEGEEQRVLAEE